MTNYELSEGVLEHIMAGQKVPNPILQILATKKLQSDRERQRYRLLISDGKYNHSFAMCTVPDGTGIVKTFSIINVTNYVIVKRANIELRHLLLILDMEVMVDGASVGRRLGNSLPLNYQQIQMTVMPWPNLTRGALERILTDEEVPSPIMQILGSKKVSFGSSDKDRYRLLISDGRNRISCAMVSLPSGAAIADKYSLVKLTKYMAAMVDTLKGCCKVLLILEMDVILNGMFIGKIIGNPKILHEKQSFGVFYTPAAL